jgi:hypothetical protein
MYSQIHHLCKICVIFLSLSKRIQDWNRPAASSKSSPILIYSVHLIHWYTGITSTIETSSLNILRIKQKADWRVFLPLLLHECSAVNLVPQKIAIYVLRYFSSTCGVHLTSQSRVLLTSTWKKKYILGVNIYIWKPYNKYRGPLISLRKASFLCSICEQDFQSPQEELSWWLSKWSNWITRMHFAAPSRAWCGWHSAEICSAIFLCCLITHPTCVENRPRERSTLPELSPC